MHKKKKKNSQTRFLKKLSESKLGKKIFGGILPMTWLYNSYSPQFQWLVVDIYRGDEAAR